MSEMRTTLPLFAALVGTAVSIGLGGCATSHHQWEKSDAPMSQVEKDKAECEYEAKAATASYSTASSAKESNSQAMGKAIGDGVVIAEKRIELTNDCMKARGYRPRAS
ncbi:hypothetical protein [Mitsuaria sp. GD03876]|uniref:hypothetical protein n=1 Tax=Mitsuaria sp. GD03876 TaxID=2975399 RepID=UPI00244C8F18|nr:hypothetical protein [Mitsuaria sp. GD03876]MDH0866402.1 hypothetical protein [Mitsuaria sp. GD03876]